MVWLNINVEDIIPNKVTRHILLCFSSFIEKAALFSNQYELHFQARNGAVDFTDFLTSFRFRVTQGRFVVYSLQNLLQDEYYTIQFQVREILSGLVLPSSDPFTLCKYAIYS